MINTDYPFSDKAFDLIAELHATPKYSLYKAKKAEFQQYLIDPFKTLLKNVAKLLPADISAQMETEKYLFSNIKKNDFNHGGAWDFYWGAFYQQGKKRKESAQLFMWMNHERIEVGFFVGVYGKEQRQRFLNNCQQNSDAIAHLLETNLVGTDILFGVRTQYSEGNYNDFKIQHQDNIATAIQALEAEDIHIARVFPKEKALQMTQADFETVMLETYKTVFPFVLLAIEDNPFPLLQEYLTAGNNGQPTQSPTFQPPRQAQPDLFDAFQNQDLTQYTQGSLITHVPNSRTKEASTSFKETVQLNPEFTLKDCVTHLHTDETRLKQYLHALERKKQAIFYGPPGTGKTYLAQTLAQHLLSNGQGFTEVVQFHPAFTYEDFIQGIRPQKVEGGLDYPIVPGRFLSFCEKAERRSPQDLCVLIIDEINRANLSQVFGELMYALEYRDDPIQLATGETCRIPENVRIIGTMNTADRSIALVDHALRRRFAFLHVPPNYDLLQKYHQNAGFSIEGLIQQLKMINQQIGDRNYEIGPSFFLYPNLSEHLESIWITEIEPYLEEYFFDQPDKVKQFAWNQIKDSIGI